MRTLTGGKAFLVEHRGDWKWLREAYALSTHWSAASHVCHVCFARGGKSPNQWSRTLRFGTGTLLGGVVMLVNLNPFLLHRIMFEGQNR